MELQERVLPLMTVTEAAAAKIKQLIAEEEDVSVLRVAIQGGGCSGFQYGLGFDRGAADGDLDDDGLASSFADVEAAAARCRFSDCAHRTEPGCAVLAATREGTLAPARLESYRKLGREAAHAERRQDALARIEERRRWKER